MSPEKEVSPEKLLQGLALIDKSIKLHSEKGKLLNDLRRTLALQAIRLGLIDGRIRREQPCPLC